MPHRWTPALVAAILTGAFALWNPPLRDLAAHTFRAEYFEQHGFAIWNNSWYGGHYLPAYSVLFPPLAALLSPVWVGAAAAVASAHLFDGLVRACWGERARWAGLWFAVLGTLALLANGWLVFALGAAFALASLRALQLGRAGVAVLLATGSALSSPVAAVFLALVAVVALRRRGLAIAGAALATLAVLGLLFPEGGQFPFWFSAWWPLASFCALALLALRTSGESGDEVRAVLVVYLALATIAWLVATPVGGNMTRLGALFGGPVVLAVVLARAPQRVRSPVVVAALVAGLAWQVVSPVRQVTESLGDPATERSYYEPLTTWLAAHGARNDRIEIPHTFNHWEAAYVAPDFSLARGWLRQLDRERNEIFYDGREPTHARYRRWLIENGIRWVAASDARLDYSAVDEDRLVRQQPPYLRLRGRLPHWDVYEVAGTPGLVRGPARMADIRPESFTLAFERPGAAQVRIRYTPYWRVEAGNACVGKDGEWTLVRADRPGKVRISTKFSVDSAWRAAAGSARRCAVG